MRPLRDEAFDTTLNCDGVTPPTARKVNVRPPTYLSGVTVDENHTGAHTWPNPASLTMFVVSVERTVAVLIWR